jgi:pimeloyl-ACP methyl ester carboxylesterase
MKLEFGNKAMNIGSFAFNFARTLMVAGTGAAELNECLSVAGRIKDDDQESWITQWAEMAERVSRTASEAAQAGQTVTARQANFRASNYFRAAMFSLPRADPRLDRYLTSSREAFHRAATCTEPRIEILDIPFGEALLPAYFLSAGQPRRRTLIVLNGGDSTSEEMVHWLGFAAVARGWNCLVFEGPGQWSALQRDPDLVMRPDYEAPVKAVVDYLVQRADVHPDELALFGPSLGAMLAARAVAFEPRIRACVCDGLIVDVYEAWHAVWPLVLQHAGPRTFDAAFGLFERVSPELRGMANHFRWMLGVTTPHDILDAWRPYNVADLASKIQCPLLLLYGEAEAAESDEKVVLSILRFVDRLSCAVAIRVFGFEDGWAASHCQIGALAPMQAVVFDWLDRAVSAPATLSRRDVDSSLDVITRYLRSDATRSEAQTLLARARGLG